MVPVHLHTQRTSVDACVLFHQIRRRHTIALATAEKDTKKIPSGFSFRILISIVELCRPRTRRHAHPQKIEKILFGSDVICATKSTSYVSPRPRLAWQMECTAMIRSGALPLLFRFNSSRVQIHRWLHILGVESIDDVDNNIQPFLFPFPRVCVRLHRPELSEPPPFICSILRVRIFCDRSSLNPLGLCSSHLHLFMTRR